MDEKRMQFVDSMKLERERRKADPGRPRLADIQAYRGNPAGLKRAMRLRSDTSLRTIMELGAADARKKQRDLRAIAAAWRETVALHLEFDAVLLGVRRQVLDVLVANQATKFRLDRLLRAGGKTHFISSCRAAIADVRIHTGGVPAVLARSERSTRTLDDLYTEIQQHLDAGLISDEQAADLESRLQTAVSLALRRDSDNETAEQARVALRPARDPR